ncbi:MAG: thermonuclease family protein [Planctomycetota bacterium]|nr:thermonuclease family protein [Planctomycetota bacterium]
MIHPARLLRILPFFLTVSLLGCNFTHAGDPVAVIPGRSWSAEDGHLVKLNRNAPGGAVADGDTVRAIGMDESIRIAGIDTEELFVNEEQRKVAMKDFDAYARAQRADSIKPVKFGTPAGHAAKEWAQKFFSKTDKVLFVHDKPEEPRGYYNRHIGHLLVDRDQDGSFEQNFAVEAVRQGHSAYFTKYGHSKLFHEEFLAAQKEAREAKRGIWNDGPDVPRHYPDYPERLLWWNRRGETIARYESLHGDDMNYYRMGIVDDLKRLRKTLKQGEGQEVTLFGTLRLPENGKPRGVLATISHKNRKDVGLVWDSGTPSKDRKIDLSKFDGEFVYLRGTLYSSKKTRLGIEIRIRGIDSIGKE